MKNRHKTRAELGRKLTWPEFLEWARGRRVVTREEVFTYEDGSVATLTANRGEDLPSVRVTEPGK